jgi:uncharacterized protein
VPELIHLQASQVQGELKPEGQRPGADGGDPQVSTLAVASTTGAQIGIWECTPGTWQVVDKPDSETFFVIEGKATIADDASGQVAVVTAGDFVTIPKGWSGRWTVMETIRKAYTIF